MKRLFRLLTAALLLTALAACGDKNDSDPAGNDGATPTPTPPAPPEPELLTVEDLAGTWHLEEWSVDSEFQNDIYLELAADLTFVLYEDITSHGHNKLTGTFTFDEAESIISGRYSDGTEWGASYTVALSVISTMRWTAVGTDDTSVYVRAQIPSDILRTSRAAAGGGFRFL